MWKWFAALFASLAVAAPSIVSSVLTGFVSKLVPVLITGGIGLAGMAGAFFYGHHKGVEEIRSEWSLAEAAALEKGRDARQEAEESVPQVAATVAPNPGSKPAPRCPTRSAYDRDCAK